MSIRIFKNSWWVDIGTSGRRIRKRSPENTRTGALAYEAVLRHKLARGEPLEETKPQLAQTFEQFAQKWLEVYVVPNNKFSEQKMKRSILKCWLLPFFGKMRIDKIAVRDIELFKAKCIKEGLARKSVNNVLAVLNKCVTTAYEWEKISGAPPKVVWLKCPPAPTIHLSHDECSLLLSHAEGTMREMILVALRTGMRQGELIGLQWSSINWENQTITVRHNQCYYTKGLVSPKNNRVRTIPMDADVYETLFRRKKDTGYVFTDGNNDPIGCRGLLARLKKVASEAGLRDIGWHTLRHTFASHLAVRGTPLHVVQMLLGHSSIATTMRYSHVAPSALRAAIEMLNPKGMSSMSRQPDGNQWSEAIQQDQETKYLQRKI